MVFCPISCFTTETLRHRVRTIGISLDTKESALRHVIRQKEIPWPQHFDGKGWDNEFGLRYGIFSIPTTWLVDRGGNLRFTETRFNLEEQVESLLARKP